MVLQVSRTVGIDSSLSIFVIRVSSSIGNERSLDSSLAAIAAVILARLCAFRLWQWSVYRLAEKCLSLGGVNTRV